MTAKKSMESFESAMERLNEVIGIIESPATPLDKALTRYKEGIKLVKFCGETLANYEAEVQLLQKEADGAFVLSPFGEA